MTVKWLALVAAIVLGVCLDSTCLDSAAHAQDDIDADDGGQWLERLESRAAQRSTDPAAWRLLGLFHLERGNPDEALASLQRAVELDFENAASHYSLARCLAALERYGDADREYGLAERIAPASQYAQKARRQREALPESSGVVPASYEIRRFDGSGTTADLAEAATSSLDRSQPWTFKLDLGALYNSNVALTPTQRSLPDSAPASAQGLLNPYFEYRLLDGPDWTAAPIFNGYFTLNENETFGALNLQSYQPGVYVERSIPGDELLSIARLQYQYTLDAFDGATFARRHAGSASWTTLRADGGADVLAWITDYTNFVDDGAVPATSSRDGWTHTLAGSRTWSLCRVLADSVTAGGELQWADVRGSDFRYFGGSVFAGLEKWIDPTLVLQFEGSVGLRDYYSSDLVPARNETIWRGSARLRKHWRPHLSTSLVFNFDRFNSANDLFQAERFLTGLIASLEY